MNIFYLDKCPHKAAELQYNKHVVKMILESAQMLCTAHHCIMGEDADVPYKTAHKNHPSTIWARQSGQNYAWLYHHMMALGNKLAILPGGILETGFEQPPQCMPDEYKDECSVQAYWNYYIGEKHVVVNKNKETVYEQRP